jgi:ribonuclease D
MEDPAVAKIGVALRDDLVDLNKIRRFKPAGFFDLNEIVKALEFENIGARNLTAMVLGRRINKAQQTSNWENEELTKAQISYAATDAWVCREIYKVLNDKGYLPL